MTSVTFELRLQNGPNLECSKTLIGNHSESENYQHSKHVRDITVKVYHQSEHISKSELHKSFSRIELSVLKKKKQ